MLRVNKLNEDLKQREKIILVMEKILKESTKMIKQNHQR